MFTTANGDRTGNDNVAIIFSDFRSNVATERTIPESVATKNAGIRLMAVGVGADANDVEVNAISSNPDSENSFIARSSTQVDSVVDGILRQLCNQL